jgi:hypothetical protein
MASTMVAITVPAAQRAMTSVRLGEDRGRSRTAHAQWSMTRQASYSSPVIGRWMGSVLDVRDMSPLGGIEGFYTAR